MSSSLRHLRGLFSAASAAAYKTTKPASPTAKYSSVTLKPASGTPNSPSEPPNSTSETPKSASKKTKTISQLNRMVKKFKEDCKSNHFRLRKSYNYETIVRRFAAASQFSLIEEILEYQKQFKDITDEGFVVRLIKLYGEAGMFDHALKLFDEMPALKCERTHKSFNAVLSACVNSKKFDKIEELFRELPEKLGIKPDIVSYNTVVKAFCEMGSLDSASEVIERMEGNGLEPDLISFNTLLDCCYRNNRMSDAEKLWALMGTKNLVPNVRSYNPKLRGLVADKRIPEAVDLIGEMRVKGVNCDIYSFNALIRGFCDDGNLEEAKRWYGEIALNHCCPDRSTFETILPFVCDKGDFVYAYKLCKEAIDWKRFVSIRVMQSVVDGLFKELKIAEAQELVDLAKSNNYFHYQLKLPTEE